MNILSAREILADNEIMKIKIIKDKITKKELIEIGKEFFDEMVKAVVDIEKEIMAVGGELHSDAAELLIENGSESKNIWGINIRFSKSREEWLEFDSLINIKPVFGNRSMGIEDLEIKAKIKKIVNKLVQ